MKKLQELQQALIKMGYKAKMKGEFVTIRGFKFKMKGETYATYNHKGEFLGLGYGVMNVLVHILGE